MKARILFVIVMVLALVVAARLAALAPRPM